MKRGATTKYLDNRQELHLNDYRQIRTETGICGTCEQKMTTHEKCQSCGFLCGNGHILSLSKYRRYELCGNCIHSWKVLERVQGRDVSFDEFASPRLIKPPPKVREGNLKELGLSPSTESFLWRGGIKTIEVLASKTVDDLLAIRMIGQIKLEEILEALAKREGND